MTPLHWLLAWALLAYLVLGILREISYANDQRALWEEDEL